MKPISSSEINKLVENLLSEYREEFIDKLAKLLAELSTDGPLSDRTRNMVRSGFCSVGGPFVRKCLREAFVQTPQSHPKWKIFQQKYAGGIPMSAWLPLWQAFLDGVEADSLTDDEDDEEEA